MARLDVVILAAGLGKRMKSDTIKVLHEASGRPLIDYVIDLANALSTERPVVVVGHQRDRVRASCEARADFAVQDEQLGTGHAVLQAAEIIEKKSGSDSDVLILSADVPLTRETTLRTMLDVHRSTASSLTLLSMAPKDPALYGRIVRATDGSLERIVEAKDATPEQLQIGEVNAGIYLFKSADLFRHLRSLSTDNAQGEYYLTDLVDFLRKEGKRISAVIAEDDAEALGVNSRSDLALVEEELNRRSIERCMTEGVTFRNPASTMLHSTVRVGQDTIIYPGVVLEGTTTIGMNCVIESGVFLRNVTVGDHVHLKVGSVAEASTIESGAAVGPYAHLRPGTHLGADVKVGNFVETKKAVFGRGAKASHLSYIGDAEVGADVNIGAGTITCNYDGVNKHKTVLEDGVFIGSDTQLVAPVRVGKGAYVGAGTTVTKDVPADALALSRIPQRVVDGWAARKREEMRQKKGTRS